MSKFTEFSSSVPAKMRVSIFSSYQFTAAYMPRRVVVTSLYHAIEMAREEYQNMVMHVLDESTGEIVFARDLEEGSDA